MTHLWEQGNVVSWSRTQRSHCYIFKANDIADLTYAMAMARTKGLSVIPHGAGHSYTDAALNSEGLLIDTTGMHRILSWDAEQGIMQVEPGVTIGEVARLALADCWWPAITPSTAEATIGGCVAMNVNGKNAWKYGSFGEHVLSLTVLLASGQTLTLSPTNHPELFRAFVGSAGLLGIITSVTLQLQRIPSAYVDVRLRSATSLNELLQILGEEQAADFLEGWVDGFARGDQLGRGIATSALYRATSNRARWPLPALSIPEQLKQDIARCSGTLGRPVLKETVRSANKAMYCWSKWWGSKRSWQQSLFHATYYAPAMFTGYQALLPQGAETFQAFVPYTQAEVLFKEMLQRSQANNFIPLWCTIKRHRQDSFLLGYQLDGYSLELNYQVASRTIQQLRGMLQGLMELVIAAGGRFYLAKDSLLTNRLYRRSIGDQTVEAFLKLKQFYDPEMRFQSNLFHRVFQASLPATNELCYARERR
ncbi:FAD-binding oxidoreductase [Ktedonosporobacter rubrisoli]|uniref:FAD-binding oxidoreductase n=1 Tax=Ktedonosporobacter rubrisoli TaxID=2509675 RepID=A0A4P6JI06_KTERU|nr:FAD-binding oxidoreductase [Ktedonosporobacter rubrisoli]QBD74583.1 FAD-binding oxidoreductase [Ktedonosporobacter rubrisoli]